MDVGSLFVTGLSALTGFALLYLGGEALVRGSAALALQMGISRMAVGLTVVAFGTSAPELVVSVDAALTGASDIAIGNVVGSNIANIALILGLAALLHSADLPGKIARLDLPLMLLASGWLVATLLDGEVGRLEGVLLLAGLLGYVAFTFWEARAYPDAVDPHGVPPSGPTRSPVANLGLVAAGLLLLVGGGHLLVDAAVSLATAMGVSQAVIGLTIVAIGTSLPELATSVVAAARRHSEIAVGNVVGSCMFNILGILGTTATVRTLGAGGITPWDLGLMLVLAVGLLVFSWTTGRLTRLEGAVLVAVYVAYLIWLLAG